MKITTATCPLCQDEIYSRANHDFRYCKCRNLFVDAGPGVGRYGADKDFEKVKRRQVEIAAHKEDLYSDWNEGDDHYGRVSKPGEQQRGGDR